MKPRSFFGPFLLITIGLIWLLISLQVIPAANLWALPRLVPYILMALGLALLLRARWTAAGQVVTVLVLVGAVLAIVFAPQLGWNRGAYGIFDGGFWGSVPGSGHLKTETRAVSGVDSIALRYPAEFIIEQADTESVTIEAEDNLISQISTQVEDGQLIIENREGDWSARVDPSKPVKITITVKDLSEIDFSAAGDLKVKGLETETLKIVLSGAGQIELEDLKVKSFDGILSGAGNIEAQGTADHITLIISGFGSFKAGDLESITASIRISGAGDAVVAVEDELKASITGAGSIKYFGSPKVEQNISGAGSVESAD